MITWQVLYKYAQRFLRLWLIWFWFFVLDIVSIFLYFVGSEYIPPYWLFVAIPLLGIIVANIKLFAELEGEKQVLQHIVQHYENENVILRFLNTENFCDTIHLNERGIPETIVVAAWLKVEKKGVGNYRLHWRLGNVELPKFLIYEKEKIGEFLEARGTRPVRDDSWHDRQKARYNFPVKVSPYIEPKSFAEHLLRAQQYCINIEYYLDYGFDKTSAVQTLVLEGCTDSLKHKMCEEWDLYGPKWLAEEARCS